MGRGTNGACHMSRQQNVWMTEPDEAKLSLVSSFVLHAIAAGALATYFLLFTELSGNTWGGAEKSQGAIQATLVSSAPTIPLPHPQQPTENVLATETPSPAPAPPTPAAKPSPSLKKSRSPSRFPKRKPPHRPSRIPCRCRARQLPARLASPQKQHPTAPTLAKRKPRESR
jgi:protein TonB